ncbi:hypothetical protein WJX75_009374 [Coccomyxa subellipsoidea]|uniref:JmjC domain-containing protein n=1 Tax=Coccomyxa subellipsoidea TaxID=248742 RepID=A0ABR2Z5U8_9CHLO
MPLNCVRKIDARNLTVSDFQQNQANNRPVVLTGLIDSWPALRAWSGNDGKKHLTSLAGKASVQVMVSDEGQYRGDMAHRSSMTMTFEDFLSTADRLNGNQLGIQQLYLAQSPLMTSSSTESSLSPLLADISEPQCLEAGQVSHINLWMCTRGSRSSLHYDPYHNLLCVVTGSKEVRCMSPAATQWLYPYPLYSESPNHSAVDFTQPDGVRHPLYAEALKHQLSAHLQAGDALFLPEGWWHQVDSEEKDWELRAAERLAAALSEEFLQQASAKNNAPEDPGTGAAGLGLGDVSVQLMAAMDAWTLRRVLLAVARRFPRTLEAFLCGGLSPAAAELLTARFEAADAQLTHEGRHGEQQRFYEELYAVAERPESVLQALVHQKEEFARQACGMVLREAFQLPSL